MAYTKFLGEVTQTDQEVYWSEYKIFLYPQLFYSAIIDKNMCSHSQHGALMG